jgi:hypothetical protein
MEPLPNADEAAAKVVQSAAQGEEGFNNPMYLFPTDVYSLVTTELNSPGRSYGNMGHRR